MRFVVAVVTLAAGCDAAFGIDSVTTIPDTAIVDAAAFDAAPLPADQSDPGTCFGSAAALVPRLCVPANVPVPATLIPTMIDTDGNCPVMVPQTDGPALCVFVAQMISIPSAALTRATGSHPLVLLGESGIEIDGTLNVASSMSGGRGAGADADCGTTNIDGAASQTGGSGGAGGSFGGGGGMGGGGSGVVGGTPAAAVQPLLVVRGGCPGGGGGAGNTLGSAETEGGGAVYLVSSGTITVAGTINASGAGGLQGIGSAGGAGGGSGGFIGFDAPAVTVSVSAQIFANGGGGGQGGTPLSAPGADPSAPLAAAQGGDDGAGTAAGGNGAALNSPPTNGRSGGGGGGGGGGAGRILIFTTTSTISTPEVSPTPG